MKPGARMAAVSVRQKFKDMITGGVMFENTKKSLTYYAETFMVALLIAQPILDVISYFMLQNAMSAFTTALRTIILLAVSAYGFIISDEKRSHLILYAVLIIFWIFHILACLRGGYSHPIVDFGEFLKLAQFPLWTFAFIAVFRQCEDLNLSISGILVINFCIILMVIALSFLTKHPGYTYDYPDRNVQIGLLGWFYVSNAQSAIVSVLVPFVLLWAFQRHNLLLFCIAAALGFGLLYFTGTRLAFYAAILIALTFSAVIIWNRQMLVYCVPLFLAVILLFAFRGQSPMAERQALTADSYAVYQEKTDEVMGNDKDFVYDPEVGMTAEIAEKVQRVYLEVYSGKGIYGNPLLGDLIHRFGVEKVMEAYDYSIKPQDLYNVREKKLICVKLIREEKGFMSQLFGFEYAELLINQESFDPENDFPALIGFYGYAGLILYAGFILYFILSSIWALIEEFPDFLTIEFGTVAISFTLLLGAAQLSGNVLRKPSVVVYLALFAAIIYTLINKPTHRKNFNYRKKSVVYIKTP